MAKPKNLTTESKDVSWSKLQEIVRDREAWRTTVHGVTESQTRLRGRTTICMRKKERTDRNMLLLLSRFSPVRLCATP